MGLRSWWKDYREESAVCEVDELFEEFVQEQSSVLSRHQLIKLAKRQNFPHKGDDLLAKKEVFIDDVSVLEREFQKAYMAESANAYSVLKSKVSRDKEQKARLMGQYMWRQLRSHMK